VQVPHANDSDVFWSKEVPIHPVQNRNVNVQKLKQCHIVTFVWWLLWQNL